MTTVCIAVECRWGLIPGTAEDGQQWFFTRAQVEAAESMEELIKDALVVYQAHLNPAEWNWCELTWIYY